MYDKDGSGFLDRSEVSQGLWLAFSLNKVGHNDIKELSKSLMDRLDASRDGKISRDEFVDGILKNEDLKNLLYFETI